MRNPVLRYANPGSGNFSESQIYFVNFDIFPTLRIRAKVSAKFRRNRPHGSRDMLHKRIRMFLSSLLGPRFARSIKNIADP